MNNKLESIWKDIIRVLSSSLPPIYSSDSEKKYIENLQITTIITIYAFGYQFNIICSPFSGNSENITNNLSD